MTDFQLEVYQNEYLPEGAREVNAIVTVTASGDPDRPAETGETAAEVIIIDCSGSMHVPPTKLAAAKAATIAAIDTLRDGVAFAVVAGTDTAKLIYPQTRTLVPANPRTRAAAKQAVGTLRANGGTAMGQWLQLADRLFAGHPSALRHAILLTDGQNMHETPRQLARTLKAVTGRFVCDCRGIGTDWQVGELREIAGALLGTVDIMADPSGLAADFRAMTAAAMGKAVADVSLRLWTPQGATVRFVKQVEPALADLTARRVESAPRSGDYPTGSWGSESRDYHICIEVTPAGIGEKMLAGRVSMVLPATDEVLGKGRILAVWTDDTALSTKINREVAHYTGQAELAEAIQEGLEARKAGDVGTATARLGRAVALATGSRHEDTARLLAKVVDIEDAATGTVRLKREVDTVDEMTLDTRSTSPSGSAGSRARAEMPTCPNGHDSQDPEFCDVCGRAMRSTAAPPNQAAPDTGPPAMCPACDTPLDGRFCEACGHDSLATPPPRAAPQPEPEPAQRPRTWSATVRADRDYYNKVMAMGGPDADSITFPTFCPDRYFSLRGKEITIGRRSASRGINPDIDLTGPPEDPGVSHLHAVLRVEPDGSLSIEDIGSANGTILNDSADLPAHTRRRLADGDRIHIGAWTTITVQQED